MPNIYFSKWNSSKKSTLTNLAKITADGANNKSEFVDIIDNHENKVARLGYLYKFDITDKDTGKGEVKEYIFLFPATYKKDVEKAFENSFSGHYDLLGDHNFVFRTNEEILEDLKSGDLLAKKTIRTERLAYKDGDVYYPLDYEDSTAIYTSAVSLAREEGKVVREKVWLRKPNKKLALQILAKVKQDQAIDILVRASRLKESIDSINNIIKSEEQNEN